MRSAYKSNYHLVQAHVLGGPGSDVAKRYNVRIYPMLVFFDATGEVLCRTRGFKDAEDGLALDRYVQAIAKDSKRRSQQNSDTCGRVPG